jgi:hypothetical protein
VLWSWSTLIWSESADRTTEKIKKLIWLKQLLITSKTK